MEERDILLMAALIAAVRTARFEGKDFQGAATPRMMGAISDSLALARMICRYSTSRSQQHTAAEASLAGRNGSER